MQVWQKEEDLFNYYFVNDDCENNCCGNNWGLPYSPSEFPASNSATYGYHIETQYIQGASYNWTSSSSDLVIDPNNITWDISAEHGSKCYFHGLTSGSYNITLTVTPPRGKKVMHVIPIVISGALSPLSLSTPTWDFEELADCYYKICVNPLVENADDYKFYDGFTWANFGSSCYTSTNPSSSSHYGPIYVQAINNGCRSGNVTYSSPATIQGDFSPSAPTIHLSRYCDYYHFWVDAVPNALGYYWSYDGGATWSFDEGDDYDGSISNNILYLYPSYNVKVKYVMSCYESPEAGLSGTTSVPDYCFRLEDKSDSSSIQTIDKAVKIYPSPSGGNLFIENNLSSKISVTLKFINGVVISNYNLNKEQKIEINNLDQGMIMIEILDLRSNRIIERKLVPIIRP